VISGPVDFLRDISYAMLQTNPPWMDYEQPRPALPFRPPLRGAMYQEYKVLETISNSTNHQANFIPNIPALKSKNRYIDILPCES